MTSCTVCLLIWWLVNFHSYSQTLPALLCAETANSSQGHAFSTGALSDSSFLTSAQLAKKQVTIISAHRYNCTQSLCLRVLHRDQFRCVAWLYCDCMVNLLNSTHSVGFELARHHFHNTMKFEGIQISV